MVKKTTYLFGAGASCNSLPILKEMNNVMGKQIEFISNKENQFPCFMNNEENITECRKEYISDLEWLKKASEKHASVDTFARKLYLQENKNDLLKLKNCLSVFLFIEQLHNPVDPRYDTFFATLLESKFKMPEALNIISWNYDMQFELAYQIFSNIKDIYEAQSTLGVYSKHNDNWRSNERKDFGIYKLNGSTIVYESSNSRNIKGHVKSIKETLDIETLNEIFKNYHCFKKEPNKHLQGISFAWEEDKLVIGGKDIVNITKNKTKDTEVLVIIGYSIPFFNRNIDRDIIKNMTKLEKVYFQAPDTNGLIERFNSIRNDLSPTNLVPITDCTQFYIPNEL